MISFYVTTVTKTSNLFFVYLALSFSLARSLARSLALSLSLSLCLPVSFSLSLVCACVSLVGVCLIEEP